MMPDVLDVAKYILNCHGPTTTMKLQKLVYYSQAWSLVWDEEPIFSQPIEAWVNGPVVRKLWNEHGGLFKIESGNLPKGDAGNLANEQRDTVDVVLDFYGEKSPQWLSDLTHMEDPWNRARERAGLGPTERGSPEIWLADMAEYYSSLLPSNE